MKVTFEELKAAFNRVLLDRGVKAETADACAEMFARTTESGVYSHGVNVSRVLFSSLMQGISFLTPSPNG
ncbi:2%2C3-diketo-L-gulonate reductase [Enterobacter roggenkampii]|nr:2%2C3-diketo-L-gulonate reductase [Enterobacter roggenkampii]